MATLSIRQANGKGKGSCKRRHDQQLLPGIPDEITLHEISPNLPWKVFYILSAVSRAWGHAIRSRNVYDARVLSHLTETFVIVNLKTFQGTGIGLWSMRENYLITLPRIMHRSHLVVPFDGRIYVLGREECNFATRKLYYNDLSISDEVYDSVMSDEVLVLDVGAGEKLWKKCASMTEERRHFDGAVIGGKIYVCGGDKIERGRVEFCGSEVYDPKKDLWSPIKPMAERYCHQIDVVGEELFVHSGRSKSGKDCSNSLNVYHPGKNEWRVVDPFFESGTGHLDRYHFLFVARGKLHSIDHSGIYVYKAEENSWTELHSFSSIRPARAIWRMGGEQTAVVHVDGELLIKYWVLEWVETLNWDDSYPFKKNFCVAKSNGFGGGNKEIVWQKVPLTNSLPVLSTKKLTSLLL